MPVVTRAARVLRGEEWGEELLQRLPPPRENLLPWMERHTRLLKSDRYSRVGLLELNGQTCFLKCYVPKSPLQRLGFHCGLGRAVTSFDAAGQLLSAGLHVPAPRACLRAHGGMLLLTEGLRGDDLRALWLTGPTEVLASSYMQRVGTALSALHLAGFAHGDCKWSNLLLSGETFYLVDLENVRRVGAARGEPSTVHARQFQDIARFTADAEALEASAGQYQVFLDSYCAGEQALRGALLEGVRPRLEAIRNRHRSKYGHRHPPLL